jgi:hypothetical protein
MPVLHCKREAHDVYIGRGRDPRTGEPGRWGNPFRIGRDGSRKQVIAAYRRWLWDQLCCGEIELRELIALHGKRLGCWCAPEQCHGQILEAASMWALAEQARRLAAKGCR